MKNYQKILQKIIKMETKSFEKMRLTSVLIFALLFGLILQQVVFASDDALLVEGAKIKKQPASLVGVQNIKNEYTEIIEKEVKILTENKIEKEDSKDDIKKIDLVGRGDAFIFNSNPDFLPIRNYSVSDIELKAKGAIVLSEDGKILYKKNINQKLKIASLTKVVAAVVILENLDMDEIIIVRRDIIENTEGVAGRFAHDEKLRTEDLLKIMLVISSNDAAAAFDDYFKSKNISLVELMNKKVKDLGLKNTNFSNPIGFDDENNYSTAYDYAKFIINFLDNEKLWNILSIKSELIKSLNPAISDRMLISSDKLAFRNIKGLFGGKTGYTKEAGGCLMVGFLAEGQNGRKDSRLISVVLGAKDTQSRFDETERLIRWIKEAYIF